MSLALPKWINPTMKQTWTVSPFYMNKISLGMAFGFTSCFLNAIKEPDSPIKMDINMSSWFVSSLPIALILGFAISSCFIPKCGRRLSALIMTVPAIVSLIISIFTSDVISTVIARILSGITMGGVSVISAAGIGEFVSPQNRGMFYNILTAVMNLGTLFMHVVGNYIHWRVLVILINLPFVVCFLITYTWPESPSWLAEKKEYEKSRQAFYWLRGKSKESTREIEELIRAQGYKKVNKTIKESLINFFLKFKMMNFWKPMLINVLLTVLIETSGRHIFPSYAAQLIKDITAGGFGPFYYNIVIDVLITLTGFLASYLIRIMTMRRLLFTTGSATFVALCLSSLSIYLVSIGTITESYSWIVLLLFAIFFILTNLGCTCVPLLIPGELFPLEHKIVGLSLAGYFSSAAMALALKIMPYMVAAFHISGAFAVLAVFMGMALIGLYFLLPETTNRTLQEIEDYFTYGKFRDGDLVPTDDKDIVDNGDEPGKEKDNMC